MLCLESQIPSAQQLPHRRRRLGWRKNNQFQRCVIQGVPVTTSRNGELRYFHHNEPVEPLWAPGGKVPFCFLHCVSQLSRRGLPGHVSVEVLNQSCDPSNDRNGF